MKRLINPLPTGGVPYENEDFQTLQNEGFDALKQICAGLPGAFVLSGCGSVLGTETYYGSTQAVGIGYLVGNTSIQVVVPAGYCWIDGDIKYFAGGVFNTPFYLKSDSASFTKKTLQDGMLKNVYVTSNAVGANSKPVTGQYITCNPTPEFVFQDVVTAKVSTVLSNEIATRQSVNATERSERTNADTQLTQRLNTLTDTVDTKATKKCERIEWTDLPLASGYITTSDPTLIQTAQYMRDELGFVNLRGYLYNSTLYTTTNSYGNTTIATLPIGARPTVRAEFIRHTLQNFFGQFGTKAHDFTYNNISIQSNGAFFVNTVYQLVDPDNSVPASAAKSYGVIQLDGISFYSL